jgi:hypothetical protein
MGPLDSTDVQPHDVHVREHAGYRAPQRRVAIAGDDVPLRVVVVGGGGSGGGGGGEDGEGENVNVGRKRRRR